MDYRDEREALRGRVENLEQDLHEAKRELDVARSDDRKGRIARVEQQAAEARRLLAQLDGELAALKGEQARRWRPVVARVAITLLVGVGVIVGVMLLVLVPRSRPSAPVLVVAQAPEVAVVAARPSPPAPPKPSRRASASFAARVTRATGAAPSPGTACTVDALIEAAGGGVDVAELTVTCGDKTLYRSTEPLEGMSMNSSGAQELAGEEPGVQVYAVAYDDKGARTGSRNEVSVDTSAGVGAVWRTSVPSFHVDFSVAERSAPVRGGPLASGAP